MLCEKVVTAAIQKINEGAKEVSLEENILDPEGVEAVLAAVRKSKILRYLSFWNCKIGDKGALLVAEELQQNRTLYEIALTGNVITDIGAKALAGALQNNTSLIALRMANNEDITSEGVVAIAEVLQKHNNTIRELNLGYCRCGDIGARAFAAALGHNKGLQVLE